jgi:hypothetical protein
VRKIRHLLAFMARLQLGDNKNRTACAIVILSLEVATAVMAYFNLFWFLLLSIKMKVRVGCASYIWPAFGFQTISD